MAEKEPIAVNRNVMEVMNMNREARRKIARKNGLKNIPSIVNVKVIKAPQGAPTEAKQDEPSI